MPGLRFLLQFNPVALDHEGVRVLKEEVQQGRRCEHNRVSRAEVPNPREQATGLADVNGLVQQQADCACWPKGLEQINVGKDRGRCIPASCVDLSQPLKPLPSRPRASAGARREGWHRVHLGYV